LAATWGKQMCPPGRSLRKMNEMGRKSKWPEANRPHHWDASLQHDPSQMRRVPHHSSKAASARSQTIW
jgi:hypothetical protein